MRTKSINCILLILILISSPCFAQILDMEELPETLSTFTGAQLYSRTLKTGEAEESISQWVFPLFISGQITENLNIRLYQTVSTAKQEDGPSLSGLGSTRIRGAYSLFEDHLIVYLGGNLPLSSVEPETETEALSDILYSEVLQFGVSRLTEGFDLDAGFAFAQPFGKLSLGFGAGYVVKGGYDRLLQSGELAEYNPGDAFSVSAGLHFLSGATILRGRVLYIQYGKDSIEEEDVFQSGSEISFGGSVSIRFDAPVLTLFLDDTVKGESDDIQNNIETRNIFINRLNGGVAVAYPLFNDTLILKTRARIKLLSDDDESDAKAASFDGGFRLVITDNLSLDILASYVKGDMDGGETDISGSNLGLIINYGF